MDTCEVNVYYKNEAINLCNKYELKYYYLNRPCNATGIGDILFYYLGIKNNIFLEPFYFNLNYFSKLYYKQNPINQLEFRIKLILDLLKFNNISSEMIQFVFSDNYHQKVVNCHEYKLYSDFNLQINDTIYENENKEYLYKINNNEEYIIFHTKCRHLIYEDYPLLKSTIKNFCNKHKSNFKIIIMGERTFPDTEEAYEHGITTIYNELMELKNCNNIIDLTIENIYSNLDYENYKKDIQLIKNAKFNICFGLGGQFCSSVIFGKSTIVYCKVLDLLNTDNFNKHNYYFSNLNECLNLIKEKCFNYFII